MILMVLSATVGASLIARDVRHRALLMYFSRSITRADYLLGKFLSLVVFLLIVTLGPGLLLFLGQLGMSQERLTFGQRMGDLLAITLHSLILTVPMSSVVLAFSSLTKRTYLAAILWHRNKLYNLLPYLRRLHSVHCFVIYTSLRAPDWIE